MRALNLFLEDFPDSARGGFRAAPGRPRSWRLRSMILMACQVVAASWGFRSNPQLSIARLSQTTGTDADGLPGLELFGLEFQIVLPHGGGVVFEVGPLLNDTGGSICGGRLA